MATAGKKKATKTTKAAMAATIEQLGDLRAQIGKMESSERDLAKTLREQMSAAGCDSAESANYAARLAVRTSLSIDPAKFRRKAGDEIFAACARIDTKAARLHFDEAALEKLGKITTSTRLEISARPS